MSVTALKRKASDVSEIFESTHDWPKQNNTTTKYNIARSNKNKDSSKLQTNKLTKNIIKDKLRKPNSVKSINNKTHSRLETQNIITTPESATEPRYRKRNNNVPELKNNVKTKMQNVQPNVKLKHSAISWSDKSTTGKSKIFTPPQNDNDKCNHLVPSYSSSKSITSKLNSVPESAASVSGVKISTRKKVVPNNHLQRNSDTARYRRRADVPTPVKPKISSTSKYLNKITNNQIKNSNKKTTVHNVSNVATISNNKFLHNKHRNIKCKDMSMVIDNNSASAKRTENASGCNVPPVDAWEAHIASNIIDVTRSRESIECTDLQCIDLNSVVSSSTLMYKIDEKTETNHKYTSNSCSLVNANTNSETNADSHDTLRLFENEDIQVSNEAHIMDYATLDTERLFTHSKIPIPVWLTKALPQEVPLSSHQTSFTLNQNILTIPDKEIVLSGYRISVSTYVQLTWPDADINNHTPPGDNHHRSYVSFQNDQEGIITNNINKVENEGKTTEENNAEEIIQDQCIEQSSESQLNNKKNITLNVDNMVDFEKHSITSDKEYEESPSYKSRQCNKFFNNERNPDSFRVNSKNQQTLIADDVTLANIESISSDVTTDLVKGIIQEPVSRNTTNGHVNDVRKTTNKCIINKNVPNDGNERSFNYHRNKFESLDSTSWSSTDYSDGSCDDECTSVDSMLQEVACFDAIVDKATSQIAPSSSCSTLSNTYTETSMSSFSKMIFQQYPEKTWEKSKPAKPTCILDYVCSDDSSKSIMTPTPLSPIVGGVSDKHLYLASNDQVSKKEKVPAQASSNLKCIKSNRDRINTLSKKKKLENVPSNCHCAVGQFKDVIESTAHVYLCVIIHGIRKALKLCTPRTLNRIIDYSQLNADIQGADLGRERFAIRILSDAVQKMRATGIVIFYVLVLACCFAASPDMRGVYAAETNEFTTGVWKGSPLSYISDKKCKLCTQLFDFELTWFDQNFQPFYFFPAVHSIFDTEEPDTSSTENSIWIQIVEAGFILTYGAIITYALVGMAIIMLTIKLRIQLQEQYLDIPWLLLDGKLRLVGIILTGLLIHLLIFVLQWAHLLNRVMLYYSRMRIMLLLLIITAELFGLHIVWTRIQLPAITQSNSREKQQPHLNVVNSQQHTR